MATTPIRVLVVDDHRMFAEALGLLLGAEDDIDLVGTEGSAEDALAAVAERSPHVVLMDLDLPGMDGIEATREIRRLWPDIRVVILTAFQDRQLMARAMEAGACDYVPKTRAVDGLADTIRRAAWGEIVIPGVTARPVRPSKGSQGNREGSRGEDLTTREIQILQALAHGRSTAEVAGDLRISPLTVQTHVKNILSKLRAHSKVEAVTLALRQGMIRIPGRK